MNRRDSSSRCRPSSLRLVALRLAAGVLALTSAPVAAAASNGAFSLEDAAAAPLEQLMTIQVTTVAGEEQNWFQTPAALHVITGEDLRRSGHRTLADALRTAPGVFVGSTNAHGWTVGMRGFSGGLANKTLVMIDGRAVYDPLFGGTFWEVQDILLADLDRIEVIRGPGATLWGANAVNGVINVITKHSADTQGLHARAGGGNEEQGFGSARYGGKISDKGTYRVWGKYFNRDHYSTTTGGSAHDAWDLAHGGFRVDLGGGERTRYTLQGDIYNLGKLGESVRLPVPDTHLTFDQRIGNGWANGGNVLFRAAHAVSAESNVSLQAYYDRTNRTQSAGFHVERDTADIDLRHHFHLGRIQQIQWGLGYRYTTDRTRPSGVVSYDPRSRDLSTVSGFVQDTVTIIPDHVFAMIGTKLEHNSLTGVEVQPGARLWWTPDDRNTVWASVSRPVRVPTRTEQDSFLTLGIVDTGLFAAEPPTGIFGPIGVRGNPDAKSEHLVAYELGYRRKLTENLTVDIAPFYNDYSRLLFVPKTTVGTWTNAGSGESYGVEVSSIWRALDRWSLQGSYSFVEVEIHGDILPQDEGNSPNHQLKLLSYLDVTDRLEFNTGLYYVDRIPTVAAPSYVRLDQGITWNATRNLDISIWGQNLLEDSHREASMTIEAERAFYVEATMHF